MEQFKFRTNGREEEKLLNKGYTFECSYENANSGFYHICKVFNRKGKLINTTKVHWGNRTWESYTYQTVLRQAIANVNPSDEYKKFMKKRIQKKIHNTLIKLTNWGHIEDFGEDNNNNHLVLVDSWSQYEEVWKKLEELNEKGLLNEHTSLMMKFYDYVFTDEYSTCYECGAIVHNTESSYVDDIGIVCDECINKEEHIETLIENAKQDHRAALPVSISEEMLTNMGYTVLDELYEQDEINVALSKMKSLRDDGHEPFVLLTGVGQFQVYFKIVY